MARIARLLALDEMTRAAELRAWLAAQADRLAEQSELVDAIVRRPPTAMPDWLAPCACATCPLPSWRTCKPMSISTAWNPSPNTQTRARRPGRAGLAADGPLMLHFHEAVGHDGAGRIEAAIAYAGHLEPSGD